MKGWEVGQYVTIRVNPAWDGVTCTIVKSGRKYISVDMGGRELTFSPSESRFNIYCGFELFHPDEFKVERRRQSAIHVLQKINVRNASAEALDALDKVCSAVIGLRR